MDKAGKASVTSSGQDAGGILEMLDYASFVVDERGVLTDVNAPFLAGLGYAWAEVLGRPLADFCAPAKAGEMEDLLRRARRDGLQKEVPFYLQGKDGTPLQSDGSLTAIQGDDGQPLRFYGILHDLSAAKGLQASPRGSRAAMQRELEIGRNIQTSFLPAQLPQPPGWEIASHFEAALMVSGDFYDAFMLSAGKRLGVVVGDVCDKGIGAAIYMALFQTLIHAFAEQHSSLGWMDVLSAQSTETGGESAVGQRRALLATGATPLKKAIDLTNRFITLNHGETNMFATVFFAVIDPSNGALMYINAGQNPPLVLGARGLKEPLDPTGPVVGLMPEMEFKIGQAKLEPGEILLIYTDGVVDARNPDGDFFGAQRLQTLAEKPASSAEEILYRIQVGLHKHISDADQYDDITLLAVRREK